MPCRLALVLVVLATVRCAPVDPPPSLEVLEYHFDLDQDHDTQWELLLDDFLTRRTVLPFAEAFGGILGAIKRQSPDVVSAFAHDLPRWKAALPLAERSATEVLVRMLQRRAPKDGLQGDSRLEDSVVFLNQLVMPILESTNVSRTSGPDYEDAAGGCTSILLANPKSGEVMFGRNHDFSARTPLAKTTVSITFLRGAATMYKCSCQLPWITKLSTCVRPGRFAMSLNARLQGIDSARGTSPLHMLERFEQGALRRQTLLRQVMESESYAEALERAATLPSLNSMYVILAGAAPFEGAVVTRFGNASTRSDVLSLSSPTPFIVQTNVDRWTPTGPYSTHRRDHAVALVQSLSPGASSSDLRSVLLNSTATFNWNPSSGTGEDTGAVLRPDTVLTAVMMAKQGTLSFDVWATDPKIQGWEPPHSSEVILV